MKQAKDYDPNVDKAGFEEVFVGNEQVKNGGEGSGNFGHAGRPGEVGGSGEGGGGKASSEKTALEHSIKSHLREVIGGDDVASSISSHLDKVNKNTSGKKAKTIGFNAGYSAAEMMIDSNSLDSSNINSHSDLSLSFGHHVGKIAGNDIGLKANSGFQEGFYKAYKDFGERTNKEKSADLMQPGTAFVPQGNKTEAVTNPPYRTPELGDAPEEMQKEADRIYKALRKEQFHEETPAARESAARVMWTTLEKNWKKGKDGKWVKKEKSE